MWHNHMPLQIDLPTTDDGWRQYFRDVRGCDPPTTVELVQFIRRQSRSVDIDLADLTSSRFDDIKYYGLTLLLSPILISEALTRNFSLHRRLIWTLRGSLESAWDRCAAIWADSRSVYGGPLIDFDPPFAYSLARYFTFYQRQSRSLLLEQLQHDNPYVVASVSIALRYSNRRTSLCDFPTSVLNRGDIIAVTSFCNKPDSYALGRYIRDAFEIWRQ
jgi:hypothetical protein